VPVKNLDTLLSAYADYRTKVQNPWPLMTCGAGPLKERLSTIQGVEDLGFVQPADLAKLLEKAGVFVFPSRYEPWGVALAEAAASGLPLIASDQVSSAVDMLRPYYNGLTFASTDQSALTRALLWMHENHATLPEWGLRSQHYAQAYSDANWATRWHILCQELVNS
jgi:glycosyltransferase involved in cell wall biosynthesis